MHHRHRSSLPQIPWCPGGFESVSATFSPQGKQMRSRISQAAQPSPYVQPTKTPESFPTDIYSIATPVDATHFVSTKQATSRSFFTLLQNLKKINRFTHSNDFGKTLKTEHHLTDLCHEHSHWFVQSHISYRKPKHEASSASALVAFCRLERFQSSNSLELTWFGKTKSAPITFSTSWSVTCLTRPSTYRYYYYYYIPSLFVCRKTSTSFLANATLNQISRTLPCLTSSALWTNFRIQIE